MKVAFQQTVELEEVPFKIEEIFAQCQVQLKTLTSLADTINISDPGLFLRRLDSVRRKIAVVDARLEECFILMNGYMGAMEDNSDPKTPEQDEETTQYPSVPEEISDLREE
jgi:hypothetical protein|tara:strand:- start:5305 stop:5637 length:333 start_codon:yes stop_codon:yes gene_type:complete